MNISFQPEPVSVKEENVDWSSLKSLSSDGIDMSFLDSMKKEFDSTPDPVKQLQETARLIQELKKEQVIVTRVGPGLCLSLILYLTFSLGHPAVARPSAALCQHAQGLGEGGEAGSAGM